MRSELAALAVDSIIVTALDEIAWLLNLRGGDISYSPLFKSYVFLSATQAVLFMHPVRTSAAIRKHLRSDWCDQEQTLCVEYETMHFIFLLQSLIGAGHKKLVSTESSDRTDLNQKMKLINYRLQSGQRHSNHFVANLNQI